MWRRGANKYGAKRTALGFPSKLEEAVYFKLLEREKLGEIKEIQRQSVVVLQPGPPKVRVQWKVDFRFERYRDGQWQICYAEAKGIETGEYRLKLKLWRKAMPAPIEIWKGNHRYPKMVELIE